MKIKYLTFKLGSRYAILFICLWKLCFDVMGIAHAMTSEVDKLLEAARQNASAGDLEKAVELYKQVLTLEKNHPHAQSELEVVLTGTQVSDHYTDNLESSALDTEDSMKP